MSMTADIDLWGVCVAPLALIALLAFAGLMLLRAVLSTVGFYHLVWNRNLVDIALYFVLLAGLLFLLGGPALTPLLPVR